MLDEKFHRCPDLYAIMNSFKISWGTVPGGKQWFMRMLPFVIAEMFSNGEVSEQFYNDHGFPQDSDKHGNIWKLNSLCFDFVLTLLELGGEFVKSL